MDLESVVVTGANRGIGLEFVRQLVRLANPPKYVFATDRSEDTVQELKSIKDGAEKSEVILIKMDVTNIDEVRAARKVIEGKLGANGLTLLINNAGVANGLLFPDLTEQNLLSHYATNSLGPVMVLQELLPVLEKAADRKSPSRGMTVSRAAVINISADLGSVSTAGSGQMPQLIAYMMSKAALNMAMRVIAAQVKDKAILIVLMCPGWVKTDMGGPIASFELSDSISAMMKTFPQLNEEHHGAFVDRHGEPIPY